LPSDTRGERTIRGVANCFCASKGVAIHVWVQTRGRHSSLLENLRIRIVSWA
jgi:hypothetical protein